MILPLEPTGEDIVFSTPAGTPVAHGYTRVVIGQRGPYIEFSESQILKDQLVLSDEQKWRLTGTMGFYVEYRSHDQAFVKVYFQKKVVTYADYQVGYYYISPFDLVSDKYPQLVRLLKMRAQ